MSSMRREGLVFLKLGGALLTDKAGREALRPSHLQRLCDELAEWPGARDGRLVLAHGSGSFAHPAATESGFMQRPDDALALARVAAAAARLDRFVIAALLERELAALPLPGSLLARCRAGRVESVRADLVTTALDSGLLPVLYGDAAPDALQGGCIASTEPLLMALARKLRPARVILATDVDGVYDRDPKAGGARRLERIELGRREEILDRVRTDVDRARDVSGGMASKLASMLDLVAEQPELEVRILSGLRPGALIAALRDDPAAGGTRILA